MQKTLGMPMVFDVNDLPDLLVLPRTLISSSVSFKWFCRVDVLLKLDL